MNARDTDIRRHADGSIDIDHYIRHCHRERSRAAHRAIDRTFNMPRRLIEECLAEWNARTAARRGVEPAE